MEVIFKTKSPLEEERLKETCTLPSFLQKMDRLDLIEKKLTESTNEAKQLREFFPKTIGQPLLEFIFVSNGSSHRCMRVGVVFSGGQASGGHNVIIGLFEALKKMHPESQLFGFYNGPNGIVENKYVELTNSLLANYCNTGGFDLIGSGRTKIETEEQLNASLDTVNALRLDGLVIIGGDDSNTNAAVLAEFFLAKGNQTKVIGIPKTIDGDLKNSQVEISFGFDTASKIYSEMIGNIARDALSAKKYYHFIKLMGRSASHITLECALQTHPNITLIGEEIAFQKKNLQQIIDEIVDVICKRSAQGKEFGVILIPEGLIEFVPEMRLLIKELNGLLAKGANENIEEKLSEESKKTFFFLPSEIQKQLLLERDPHGNVQVSQIATEQLFIHKVKEGLKKRSDYRGKFNPVNHFFGYEGRSAFPSRFDAEYCYALGHVAACLIQAGKTGYMAALSGLTKPVEEWIGKGIPLTMFMHVEERKGKAKPVIQKALVDLTGEPFKFLVSEREKWKYQDLYRFPGPTQFFGALSVSQAVSYTLLLEQGAPLATH